MMHLPIDLRWARYEALLCEVADCAQPVPSGASSYRLLALPTFHQPLCMQLGCVPTAGWLQISLLDQYSAIFDAVWRQRDEQLDPAMLAAIEASQLFRVVLSADQCQTYQQQCQCFATPTIHDDERAARDGITVRLDIYEPQRQQSLSASLTGLTPGSLLQPWLQFFFSLVERHGPTPACQQVLHHVRSYLPTLARRG